MKLTDLFKPVRNSAHTCNWRSNLHSLASSATSFAVSTVRGPLPLRDRARIGRIPLTTTCSAAPFSGHKWSYTQGLATVVPECFVALVFEMNVSGFTL